MRRAAQEFNGYIGHWGIWNEPNDNNFLYDPNRTVYPALAQTGRDEIKAVNPGMFVLGPDVSSGGVVSWYYAWAMGQFGAVVFDISTVHYYNDGSAETKWVDQFMNTYVYPYRQGKDVWMIETGRNFCDPRGPQEAHYQGVLERWQPLRWWWTKTFFYDLYRPSPNCSDAIVAPDGTNRPAFNLYRDWIASHP